MERIRRFLVDQGNTNTIISADSYEKCQDKGTSARDTTLYHWTTDSEYNATDRDKQTAATLIDPRSDSSTPIFGHWK